ncbi:MAG TPA: gamma-glutamyl-gamma-aminobutyrate hydrolase family protein [Ktedonobacteraceae bacterium]|nr:gamma-glutamyl-gamma-aminobutyrate hydrolase family protein [Ktedonobacteraceae bacterium]
MRPLIGIPCHAGLRAETERPIYYNNRTYIHAVERAGGVPILIPIFDDLDGLQALLPRLDGLLLSGGIDVDPRYYQEEPHPMLGETNPKLDELELALTRWALQKDVPMLGICRGMQLLNVALGGDLYQDLESQYPGSLKHPNWELPRNTLIHRVRIERGSRVEKILGTHEIEVNSLHHQATKKIGNGAHISGYADDGIAEMMEVPDHRFMVAAQCHPEELYTDHPVWSRLFRALIDACSITVVRQMEEVSELLPMDLAS